MTISPKRLEELENIPESAIDTSDIPELDENFWSQAKLVTPFSKNITRDYFVIIWIRHLAYYHPKKTTSNQELLGT